MSGFKYKRILSPSKSPQRYFGVDFFACLFHGSHPGRQYLASLADVDQTFRNEAIEPKTDILFLFKQELSLKAEGSIIGFYQNPDAYDKSLKPIGFMRQILEIILEKNMGLYLETSSDLVLNDLDLLKKIYEKAPVAITIPIAFANDLVQEKMDFFEPDFTHKLRLMHKLRHENIPVGAIMKPIIPFINDNEENVRDILLKTKEAGASFVYPTFGIVLFEEQRAKFHELIDNEYPGLKNIFMDTYGNKKSLASMNSGKLKKAFVFEAKKLRIPFGMKDIVKSINPLVETQLKLF